MSNDLLRETRDSQIRMEEEMKSFNTRLTDLENTRSRLGWGVLAAVGAAVLSLFSVVLKAAPVLLAAVLLSGCVETRTANQYRAVGTVNGQPVELVVDGVEASNTGVDPLQVIQAGMAALRGDLVAVVETVKAQPPPPPQVDPRDVAAAVVAATPKPDEPLTGNPMLDVLLAGLAAYLTGKGGIAAARKLKTPKA